MKMLSDSRPGYVLLLVLMLLTLATAALAGACRLSLDRSILAIRTAEETQHRWGTLSCRATLLDDAENVLQRAEAAAQSPVSSVRARFMLGAEQMEVVVSDEQAKVNINSLYARSGKDGAERAVGEIVRLQGGRITPKLVISAKPPRKIQTSTRVDLLHPEPGIDDENPEDAPRVATVFGSWGEVFPESDASSLVPLDGSPTVNLTCWGDGRLNLKRASRLAVNQAVHASLTDKQIDAMMLARAGVIDVTISDLLKSQQVSDVDRLKLERQLTDSAWCHSLWIISRAGLQTWSELSILDGEPRHGQRYHFLWRE